MITQSLRKSNQANMYTKSNKFGTTEYTAFLEQNNSKYLFYDNFNLNIEFFKKYMRSCQMN